jgi:putative alpha-1,2-mannosidase
MLLLFYFLCTVAPLTSAVRIKQHVRQSGSSDVLDWVDPLIGTRSGGNVFAGATRPYGMAKGQEDQKNPQLRLTDS